MHPAHPFGSSEGHAAQLAAKALEPSSKLRAEFGSALTICMRAFSTSFCKSGAARVSTVAKAAMPMRMVMIVSTCSRLAMKLSMTEPA